MVATIKAAKELVEQHDPLVYDILEEVVPRASHFVEPRADASPTWYPGLSASIDRKARQLRSIHLFALRSMPILTATRWRCTFLYRRALRLRQKS